MSYRIFVGITVSRKRKLTEERRESENAAQNDSMLIGFRLNLCYEHVNSEVEREQAHQVEYANIKARKSNFK